MEAVDLSSAVDDFPSQCARIVARKCELCIQREWEFTVVVAGLLEFLGAYSPRFRDIVGCRRLAGGAVTQTSR